MSVPEAIRATLISPNVADANFESANIVDVINHLSNNTRRVADAITPSGVIPSNDDTGGVVCCLTEAIMGITAGLVAIADAIERHTQELKETKE